MNANRESCRAQAADAPQASIFIVLTRFDGDYYFKAKIFTIEKMK